MLAVVYCSSNCNMHSAANREFVLVSCCCSRETPAGHKSCILSLLKKSNLWYIVNIVFLISSTATIPRRPLRSVSVAPPHRVSDCLRHGNSSDARAVRAVCLLMGGAAASSALGYLNSCSPSSPLATRAPEIAHGGPGGFSELPAGGSFHACSQDVDSPHFNSFDFEGDSDFDAFDCGGFAF